MPAFGEIVVLLVLIEVFFDFTFGDRDLGSDFLVIEFFDCGVLGQLPPQIVRGDSLVFKKLLELLLRVIPLEISELGADFGFGGTEVIFGRPLHQDFIVNQLAQER